MNFRQSALLLIDFQKDFLHPAGLLHLLGIITMSDQERESLVANARLFVQKMKAAGRPVIWVKTVLRGDHMDSALPFHFEQNDSLAAPSGFLVDGSAGSEIIDEVKPGADDFVLVKKGNSAFQFTYLDRLLLNLGVNTCVCIGGEVSGALADTVRQGGALGYEMTIASDATFPSNSPHLGTLRKRAEIWSTSKILEMVDSAEPIAPREPQTALLIVDMQNDFVHQDGLHHRLDPVLSDAERELIIRNNRSLIDAMRKKRNPIIFVTTIHRRDKLDSAPPAIAGRTRGAPAGADYLLEGSWGARVVDGLDMQEGDFLIKKKGRSGFGSTPLHRTLRNLGVQHCIVTGGGVNGCVEDTVREGAGLGYRVTLVPDALYKPNLPSIAVMAKYAEFKTTERVLADLAQ
jgi:nicotinamidase-related amidase